MPNDKKVIKITRILPTYVYEYTGSVRKILKSLKLYKNVKRSIAVLYKNSKELPLRFRIEYVHAFVVVRVA